MQEGAGVRQIVEDGLRRQGVRLRDLDVRLELGLQESVRRAVEAGYGVTFISRTAVESDLAAGTLAEARVQGLDVTREISLATASGRARSRVADAFVTFARERLDWQATVAACGRRRIVCARVALPVARALRQIVRWGIEELGGLLAELGSERPLLVTTARFADLELPVATRFAGVQRHSPLEVVSAAIAAGAGSDGLVGLGGNGAIDTSKAVSAATGLPLVAIPTLTLGANGRRTSPRMVRRLKTSGSGANTGGVVYSPLTLGLPREETVGTAMNALAHCAEALYARTVRQRFARGRTHRSLASGGRLGRRRSRSANGAARRRCTRHGARGTRSLPGACHGAGARRALRVSHGAMNAICLAPA